MSPPPEAMADVLVGSVDREARRALVRKRPEPGRPNGIDTVEVLTNAPGTPGHEPDVPGRQTLLVRLLAPVDAGVLHAGTVRVLGGVRPDPRINPVRVEWAYTAAEVVSGGPPPGVDEGVRRLVTHATAADVLDRVLVVRTSSSGDWSTYVLALTGADGQTILSGFDPLLSRAAFTFTVDCPSELDCAPVATACPPSLAASPVLDYLARDYGALRGRLLDRLGTLIPGWTDHSPADPAVTLVELFAALGDRLAAWQDGVAAEAYLGTARRRNSVRRHARLLGYRVRESVSARVWLAFETDGVTASAVTLPERTPVTQTADGTAVARTVPEALEAGSLVFETCAEVKLTKARNRIALYSWGAPWSCLPQGATSAFLIHSKSVPPQLRAGSVLILGPAGHGGRTGAPARVHAVLLDRDPVLHLDPLNPGHQVLEIHWSGEDALRAPLQVTEGERGPGGLPVAVAEARANVVLADHGGTLERESVGCFRPGSRDRPRLSRSGLAWAEPAPAVPRSATSALRPEVHRAQAQIQVHDGLRVWRPAAERLPGDRLAATFAVETDDDGTVRLRFGDGASGRRPAPGSRLDATYRIGGGTVGNIGPDTLGTLLPRPGSGTVPVPDGITVTNPLPAAGGADPETLAEVRALAPHAFRSPLRAVTSADYADVAMRHPGVQRAVGRRRWTGSWYAQEVILDPLAAFADDRSMAAEIAELLETHRMAGVDVEVTQPAYVPLEIVMDVCVLPGHRRADVAASLTRAFSAGRLPDGSCGFFHPDNFTFGTTLFLSDVVATAMAVPGVARVDVGDDADEPTGMRFRRMGVAPYGEVQRGRIDAAVGEVLRADSDPSNPENGRIVCRIGGHR
ncbi:baseplate J/gp47 family protein [Streptomyces nigra]|uniref:baseplate J/gp47 family protein n=1 Tax=Streptomyces nigra TaxID=1827580 RepID=UPI003629DD30